MLSVTMRQRQSRGNTGAGRLMARRPTALLPRLLADSVLPCALAALVVVGVLTLQQMRGVDDQAHMRIASQLEQLAGALEHDADGAVQDVLDEALRHHPEALQRIDLEEADGSELHSGAPDNMAFERYRRELADTGTHRAIVIHVDAQPRQRVRQKILLYGALSELGVVALALLAAFSLRHRVLLPLRRLQDKLEDLLDGDRPDDRTGRRESNREFVQLNASANALAGLLAAHRADWASIQQSSAIGALDQLRQSQAATRSKSQFMALVGHHFRQPMQALQLLTASLHPGVDAEQQAVFGQVRESIATMTRLLDALLEISRLDAGVVSATTAQFSVTELFQRERAPLMELAHGQRMTVIWRPGRHRLHGDLELASALLHQLASNAIHHVGPQGRVLIAARCVNGSLRIEVRDNGPGIAAIHQQRIFEEFVQLHGEGERREGYGLGLAIATRLAKVLGTQIGLRSEPGRGSTFWFELPRVMMPERAGASRRRELPAMHPIG
ncbi:MAG: HAMP domain-containing sensor histidine kinase [Rhodanobacter sp.]